MVRSGLLDASRSPDLAISNQAQGWIKQLTGATDPRMMQAAQSKPGSRQVFVQRKRTPIGILRSPGVSCLGVVERIAREYIAGRLDRLSFHQHADNFQAGEEEPWN
jgi:hypothetical protein